jgi:dolichol-phosphate mannosyltransferase
MIASDTGNPGFSVSIVLPTYNEGENIIHLLERLQKCLQQHEHEIIVVDDDSPDRTWGKVGEYADSHDSVHIIRRIGERGLTSALNRGFQETNKDIIAWMDCDLSHPPELITIMLETLVHGNYDAVIASRYVAGGKDKRSGQYLIQKLLSLILYTMSKWITRLPVKDITSGYIVIRNNCLESVGYLEGNYGEYFIDLMYKLDREGYNVYEVPYIFQHFPDIVSRVLII